MAYIGDLNVMRNTIMKVVDSDVWIECESCYKYWYHTTLIVQHCNLMITLTSFANSVFKVKL